MSATFKRAHGLLAGALLAVPGAGAAWAAEKAPLILTSAALDQLEYRLGGDSDLLAWDGDGYIGTDEWKLRLKSEGEFALDEGQFETLEHQLLVQHPVSDFFDLKAGVRYDAPVGPNRVYGVLGLEGLGQQWVELDADLFFSETGTPSARLDLEYALLLTNRITLTPELEIDMAFGDDEEIGVGAGLGTTELGLRLSYDLLYRDIAPYVGLHWEKAYGRTANLRREEGEDGDELFAVVGVRLMF